MINTEHKSTSNAKINKLCKALKYRELNTVALLDFYDNYSTSTNELSGHCYKSFYRYADGSPIKFLTDELNLTPKTGFVTYMDDALVNGDVPENISILVKTMRTQDAIRETIACQLLGTFGIPTCLNFTINPHPDTLNEERLLASVDFVSYGEEFNTFLDLNIPTSKYLENTLICFDTNFTYLGKTKLNELKEAYIKSYLYRCLLLGDFDFCEYNIGILKKDKHNIKLINFDFEHCFGMQTLERKNEFDIEYVKIKYPHIYNKFLNDIEALATAIDITCNDLITHYYENLMKILQTNIKEILAHCSYLNNSDTCKTWA